MTPEGEPTVELLQKLTRAKQVFYGNLEWFCEKWGYDAQELKIVEGVYLIGSHAKEQGWNDETSDLDFKIVNSQALPESLHRYKREVLNRLLNQGDKKRWIDLYFSQRSDQVLPPSWDLTEYWKRLELVQQE